MSEIKTGIVRDERYLDHLRGYGHVESPNRLNAIYKRLDKEDARGLYRIIEPRPASIEELGWNHTREYVERIKSTEGREFVQLDPDTCTSPGSWQAASLAAGGVLKAMELIYKGEIENALALVRPPGHHAERDRAMGFCLFNNVAIGAYFARNVLGLKRVLIVDWDLHHGNGTQNSFYDRNDVLYFSTHQYPYYPGSGAAHQVGTRAGKGYTVNVPLPPGAGDEIFADIFNRVLLPIGKAFSPEFVIVSAGFDIHQLDPLGGMRLSEKGFAYLSRRLLKLADEYSKGRILFCLEGGYHLMGLADGVYAVLRECAGKSILSQNDIDMLESSRSGHEIIETVLKIQRDFWPI